MNSTCYMLIAGSIERRFCRHQSKKANLTVGFFKLWLCRVILYFEMCSPAPSWHAEKIQNSSRMFQPLLKLL